MPQLEFLRVQSAVLSVFALGIITVACTTVRRHLPLEVTRSFRGPTGSYDYISVDDLTDRVFVGREFGVMTLNPGTGRTATLLKRAGVAAVLPIASTRLMLSTNGPLNTATIFDRDTGRVVADIRTGKNPDGAFYDTRSRLAFVMNGESADVTFIDVAAARAVATLAVGGTPEGAVSDGAGRLYVNVEESRDIAVIDIARRSIVARYALAGCDEPTGLAHDPVGGILIAACKNGVAKLIDASDGRDRGTIPIGQRADGSLFDPGSRTGFIPCLDGTLTVYRLDASGNATVIQVAQTREGARTAAYDPVRRRLYLPTAKVDRDRAGKYVQARDDFAVLLLQANAPLEVSK